MAYFEQFCSLCDWVSRLVSASVPPASVKRGGRERKEGLFFPRIDGFDVVWAVNS